MPLTIDLAPHPLDEGSPDERATFGRFSVRAGALSLTEGIDTLARTLEPGPLVPACHVAQWLVWNWWRLRWEPRRSGESWAFAHRMATIGEGYLWPQIEISTDGLRTVLRSRPSRADAAPFRYTAGQAAVLPAATFARAVDGFVRDVIVRLERCGLRETNLHRLWRDIERERSDPALAERRKLEALLGAEPDEADAALSMLAGDMLAVGRPAVEEIAAEGRAVSLADLNRQAREAGCALDARDMVSIGQPGARPDPAIAASGLGREAARRVRAIAATEDVPIADRDLAAFAGTSERVLSAGPGDPPFSFSLRHDDGAETVVLRSPIRVNRRFNLARVLGDRLIFGSGRLSPATHAYTYRQKAQRAFAAELLCPTAVIAAETALDDGAERRSEIAAVFGVSDYVIRLAVERLRGDIDVDEEDLAAA